MTPPRARAEALWADRQFQMAMDDPRTRVDALTAALAAAVEAEREACLADVEAEEELEGPIPLDIAVRCLTPDGATAVLRATVAATKKGIGDRIRALRRPPSPREEAK